MGKNKKSTIKYFDEILSKEYMVDSNEELQFFHWIDEARKFGIVLDYEYQPESFKLIEKTTYIPVFQQDQKKKPKEKHLLAEHVYTADFKLTLNKEYGSILSKAFKISEKNLNEDGNIVVYIDVKGGFLSNGSGRSFSINQKLVYMKYGIYVNKVFPKDFFEICGCPIRLFTTAKTNKPSKVFENYPTISKIFNL